MFKLLGGTDPKDFVRDFLKRGDNANSEKSPTETENSQKKKKTSKMYGLHCFDASTRKRSDPETPLEIGNTNVG